MRWLVLVCGAVLGGCDVDIDLSSPGTSIEAIGEPQQTRVRICAGPSGLLSCNATEAFEVMVGDELQPATEALLGFGALEAVFPVVAGNTPVSVTRTRDGATGVADLPEPFDLALAVRGSELELTWQQTTGDPMAWSSELYCPSSGTTYFGDKLEADDDGRLELSTGSLPDGEGEPDCRASITLTRHRDGTIDRVYPDGSRIEGQQVRTVTVDLAR